jgi:hypothetical protein
MLVNLAVASVRWTCMDEGYNTIVLDLQYEMMEKYDFFHTSYG